MHTWFPEIYVLLIRSWLDVWMISKAKLAKTLLAGRRMYIDLACVLTAPKLGNIQSIHSQACPNLISKVAMLPAILAISEWAWKWTKGIMILVRKLQEEWQQGNLQ